MVMVCLFALAPVSCRAMGGDQGGVTGDDACTAATTLAQQFIDGLDQWDQSTVLDTLVPDQRLGARAAWVAANQVRERQNVDIDFEDLTFECLPADDGTQVAVDGTVILVNRDTGAETQRVEGFHVELGAAQQGDAWYLLVDLPDIMARLRGE